MNVSVYYIYFVQYLIFFKRTIKSINFAFRFDRFYYICIIIVPIQNNQKNNCMVVEKYPLHTGITYGK